MDDKTEMLRDSLEKVDVAIYIFAKPFQSALSLLSLIKVCGRHINKLWLQFEPVRMDFDQNSIYAIADYIINELKINCHASQPSFWLSRTPVEKEKLKDTKYRMGIRYEYAFENTLSRLLFIMHNDVFILKDIIGDMKKKIGNAFIIGKIGQCWNCPAANARLMSEIMNKPPCTPLTYQDIKPTFEQLNQLYKKAREYNIYVRPYGVFGFSEEFIENPWPLPECRVNEWACLINVAKTRPLCIPHGECFTPGAFRYCVNLNLDTNVAFFRDMHRKGLKPSPHMEVNDYLKHWVGHDTNQTKENYIASEKNAEKLLQQHFPEYICWFKKNANKAKPPVNI